MGGREYNYIVSNDRKALIIRNDVSSQTEGILVRLDLLELGCPDRLYTYRHHWRIVAKTVSHLSISKNNDGSV